MPNKSINIWQRLKNTNEMDGREWKNEKMKKKQSRIWSVFFELKSKTIDAYE